MVSALAVTLPTDDDTAVLPGMRTMTLWPISFAAAEKCAVCHGCDRGDMLGAFSYTLRRED